MLPGTDFFKCLIEMGLILVLTFVFFVIENTADSADAPFGSACWRQDAHTRQDGGNLIDGLWFISGSPKTFLVFSINMVSGIRWDWQTAFPHLTYWLQIQTGRSPLLALVYFLM